MSTEIKAVRLATGSPDIEIENHGSIVLLQPMSPTGREWCEEHIAHAMRAGRAYVVEPRYVQPILDGMSEDGLTLQGGFGF